MEVVCAVALAVALGSAIVAGVAYWRTSGRRDVERQRTELAREIEGLRERQRATMEDLARRVRARYEDTRARIGRADERLAVVRASAADGARTAIDRARAELAAARCDVEAAIDRLTTEASSHAEATEVLLRRRVQRLEGRVHLLAARAEMARAERLASRGEFWLAEELLEDAVGQVREVKLRVGDAFEEDPAFVQVLGALHEAIRSVRDEAADHEQQLRGLMAASDSLIASLAVHEQRIV